MTFLRASCTTCALGATENARPENVGLENDGFRKESQGLENAWLENDGKIIANSGQNYGVWKMQDWKMTDHVN